MLYFLSFFLFFFLNNPLRANHFEIKDFSWKLNDIKTLGLSPQQLFDNMDRDFINVNSAICSNSAHLWSFDFFRKHQLNSGKIFVFYTLKNSKDGLKTWWYHVAPLVFHHNDLLVMDRGYPGLITRPQSLNEWFKFFVKESRCKEIQSHEHELIELMFKQQVFPQETTYGKHDCYYKIAPNFIWTPSSLAKSLLGRDEQGRPVKTPNEFNKSELYQACLEATTTKLTYSLPRSRSRCRYYLSR